MFLLGMGVTFLKEFQISIISDFVSPVQKESSEL